MDVRWGCRNTRMAVIKLRGGACRRAARPRESALKERTRTIREGVVADWTIFEASV